MVVIIPCDMIPWLILCSCLFDCLFPICGRCTGLLLRMFMLLYDTEIVEEEAFVKWKEDVNDTHPGKGKALFQVRHRRQTEKQNLLPPTPNGFWVAGDC